MPDFNEDEYILSILSPELRDIFQNASNKQGRLTPRQLAGKILNQFAKQKAEETRINAPVDPADPLYVAMLEKGLSLGHSEKHARLGAEVAVRARRRFSDPN